ncbi:hypothetical protein Q7O_000328 [Pectobacterium carotovorum subsp. carotovorum PCCS1]|nr:hypothetical protein [Pectobacterium carotovorum subsp. carotovorum PCCS1]
MNVISLLKFAVQGGHFFSDVMATLFFYHRPTISPLLPFVR